MNTNLKSKLNTLKASLNTLEERGHKATTRTATSKESSESSVDVLNIGRLALKGIKLVSRTVGTVVKHAWNSPQTIKAIAHIAIGLGLTSKDQIVELTKSVRTIIKEGYKEGVSEEELNTLVVQAMDKQ